MAELGTLGEELGYLRLKAHVEPGQDTVSIVLFVKTADGRKAKASRKMHKSAFETMIGTELNTMIDRAKEKLRRRR